MKLYLVAVPKMTYYVSSGILNTTHYFTILNVVCILKVGYLHFSNLNS